MKPYVNDCLFCSLNTWAACTVCNIRWCEHHWIDKCGSLGHCKKGNRSEFGWCGKVKVGWDKNRILLLPCKEWGDYKEAIQ